MRVAMSHALVKKTFQMDACIHSGMFFCKHTTNAATTRDAKHSESVGMAQYLGLYTTYYTSGQLSWVLYISNVEILT